MRLRCRLLGKQFVQEKEGKTEATNNEDHEPIEKGDNEYHKLVCLKRKCSECGVQAVNFSISELNDNLNNDSVTCKWSKYEYITL